METKASTLLFILSWRQRKVGRVEKKQTRNVCACLYQNHFPGFVQLKFTRKEKENDYIIKIGGNCRDEG
jgi:hypothetical protein